MDGGFPRKKSFREIDIPPRKLLSRRLASLSSQPSMEMFFHQQNDSPQVLPEETLFHKFLPNSTLDDDSDPYASEKFRMYEFKIRKCTRSRSHDWTDCPFAHPGEKARRRCPRRFNYSGTICPDFRRGSCVRGDNCDFSHGVFECWLHPTRYRTEACKDGKNCQRKICFFAHTPTQLRSVDPMVSPGDCGYFRCNPGIHTTISPTSILDINVNKKSPPPSPQLQLGNGFSPVSRFSKQELMSSQAIMDLMQSIKVMNVNAIGQTSKSGNNDQQRSLFAFSPSTPSVSGFSGSARGFKGECSSSVNNLNEDGSASGSGFKGECSSSANNVYEDKSFNESSTSAPDFDWVDDLLT